MSINDILPGHLHIILDLSDLQSVTSDSFYNNMKYMEWTSTTSSIFTNITVILSKDQIPEEEKRLSQLIRQSYTMRLDDVSQEEEQWTTVGQKDFVGVRNQFYTFVYNRTCNLKEYARQKA